MPHSTLFAQSITTSLRNLQDQYENVVNFGIKSSIEVIQGVACDLETSLFMVDPSEETLNGKISNHKEMQDLDENVRVLVTELLMNERTVAILRELEQKLIHGEVEPGSANEWFEQKLESQSQISDQNITSNLLYRNFRDSVLKIRKPDETWGAGDDDEEIRMVGSTISIHCPITRAAMRNPYTISTCRHSFSEAIFSYIGQPCPITGCRNQHIMQSSITKDAPLGRRIAVMLRNDEMD